MSDPRIDENVPLAHNCTGRVPIIIENPELYPFSPGERESEWHVATDDEWSKYVDYWKDK